MLLNWNFVDVVMKPMKSYLCYRSQVVSVHVSDIMSEKGCVMCGVLLGSILGPPLFLIFKND